MSIHMDDTPTVGPSVPGNGYGLGDTIYSAIKRALSDMEGGGGGGVDVGEPVMVLIGDIPVVGNHIADKFLLKGVSSGIGAQKSCSMSYLDSTLGFFTDENGMIASGITISNFKTDVAVSGFYDVTVDMDNGTYSAIDEITSSVDYSVGSGNLLTFTIPAIEHDALIIAIDK